MFKIFDSNKPIVLFILPFLALLLWLPEFSQNDAGSTLELPLLYGITSWFLKNTFISKVVLFVLLLSEALLLNNIVIKHGLLAKSTNLTSVLFVVLCAGMASYISMNPIIFANLFLILALDKVLSIYNQANIYKLCFHAGLYTSIATHFYLPAGLMIVLFFIALVLNRAFDWRDWGITILGFLVPFMYLWTYHFWYDSLTPYYSSLVNIYHPFNTENITDLLLIQKLAFLFFGFMTIVSVFKQMARVAVRQKNLLTIVWVYYAICLLIFLMNDYDIIAAYILLSIPLSIALVNYFLRISKRWQVELLFSLLLLTVVSTLLYNTL